MGVLKSILVDDEVSSRRSLHKVIEDHCPDLVVVGEADSVESGRATILRLQPDLVFLDVEMKDGTGFDLLDSLEKITFGLIFVTAFEKYAIRAFHFSALDYLLKPVGKDDLRSAVDKLQLTNREDYDRMIELLLQNRFRPTRIALPVFDGYRFIDIDRISYCVADGNYTKFCLEGGENILVTRTLKEYDGLLDLSGFYRIHHSYLVNLQKITRYKKGDGGTVVMSDGIELEVARRRKEGFLRNIRQR